MLKDKIEGNTREGSRIPIIQTSTRRNKHEAEIIDYFLVAREWDFRVAMEGMGVKSSILESALV